MRKDIDFNLTVHPLTGDLSVKMGENAVKQSLRNIVLSVLYSRGYNVEFGTNVQESLFEPNVQGITAQGIKAQIVNAIQRFEPGVELLEVYVDGSVDEGSTIDIKIYYNIVNENIDRQLSISV